jgi:putative transposase
MSTPDRRALVDRSDQRLSVRRQCELLGIARSGVYRPRKATNENDLALMRRIDELFTAYPFLGSRRMAEMLGTAEQPINRKRMQRLMRKMGIAALGPKRRTTKPAPGHKIFPYLLRPRAIERPNQVWTADITYIPIGRGFLYLVAVMDWASRAVLAWRLSNTMDVSFCVSALGEALARFGTPEICKVGDERRTAFRRPVSRRLSQNRTCAFRYASGSPEGMAKSGVLIHARRNRSTRVQLSKYCSTAPWRQSRLVGRRRLD